MTRSPAPGAVVLQTTKHPVRRTPVHCHTIKLRQCQVVAVLPVLAPVPGFIQAAIIAQQQMITVCRVYPKRVVVHMRQGSPIRFESLAPILAHIKRNSQHPHSLSVGGIHPDLPKIERSRAQLIHLLPTQPTISGFKNSTGLGITPGCRRLANQLLDIGHFGRNNRINSF